MLILDPEIKIYLFLIIVVTVHDNFRNQDHSMSLVKKMHIHSQFEDGRNIYKQTSYTYMQGALE